ncbi:MAG TPA: hypothetical protein VHB54_18085 [Mucilaginibacter sp.]|nr:hypothetical protein [Mucilaginibacter sp.]
MIAVVSSTIKPLTESQRTSFYSFEERLEQTKKTLVRLQECGFKEIYLADNSPELDQQQLQDLLSGFKTLRPFHVRLYQFANKGVSELMMLLYLTGLLPREQAIFKISGRYYPTADFKKPAFEDFAVKGYHFPKRTGTISTRAYWVKDSDTFHRFLLQTLAEVYAYPERIVGVGSFFRQVFGKKKEAGQLNISIEFAAANVLKQGAFKINLLDNLGIEGLVAGADAYEKIHE